MPPPRRWRCRPTDATNPARYGVYAFIDDTAYSAATPSRAYANVTCIRGTPAGSPVTPTALAAWSASALLWEFQLPANATAVTNTILDAGTDRRVRSGGQSRQRPLVVSRGVC
jgi:predicted metalloprotease with PDZ domain